MKFVFVTVGTDHHPFDRLVRWTDEWFAGHDPELVSCLIQYGHAQPPIHAEGLQFMKQPELWSALAGADVVVTHGGPATVLEAERQHHTPLCVPRDPRRGEHVDEHQIRFSRVLAKRQRVHVVASRGEFFEFLDEQSTRKVHTTDASVGVRDAPDGMGRLADVVATVTRQRRPRR